MLVVAVPALVIAAGVAVLTASGSDTKETVTVTSGGMMPTLAVGQKVVVDPDAYKSSPPGRGDIIAFGVPEYPGLVFIKRVVGLPGDRIDQDGAVVLVNGVALDEPYVIPDTKRLGPWTVEPGHVFVMGDNRPNSNDSRHSMGQIPLGAIQGKVLLGQRPGNDALPPGRLLPQALASDSSA